jgi:Ca-activated chloride channel family protein
MGNYKDDRMEQISNAGNGNYFYIDNILEAEKVFSKEMQANLFTIAKDVKIQIEFNPNTVKAYRLIGYENRMLAKEDFDNDAKDAGELGAGHTVTAIYEVILNGSTSEQKIHEAADLKYQTVVQATNSADLMTVKFRYKKPKADKSILIEQVLAKGRIPAIEATSDNFRFSAAVAGFGMLLRDSEFKGNCTYETMIDLANASRAEDSNGYRSEFIQLVKKTAMLSKYDKDTAEK